MIFAFNDCVVVCFEVEGDDVCSGCDKGGGK